MILVMMMGRTAAGKTTLAHYLANRLSARYVSEAALKRSLVDAYQVANSLDESLRDLGYAAAAAVARRCMERSESVIIDAAYHRRHRRRELYDATRLASRELVVIYCSCTDIDETRRRIEARQQAEPGPFTQANTFEVFRHIDANFEELEPGEIEAEEPSASVRFSSWTNQWSMDARGLSAEAVLAISSAFAEYASMGRDSTNVRRVDDVE